MGLYAKAAHEGSFVYGDASTYMDENFNTVTSTGDNQFVVRASGGVFFYSSSDLTSGVTLAPGSGSWANLSDRAMKENFHLTDGEEVLGKLAAMPIQEWNYISEDDNVRHLGPVAQDFHAAFGLGTSDKTITAIDADGVALLAIQALEQRTREIAVLRAENEQLRRRLDALEAALGLNRNH